jgi:hypothetical protein
VFRVLALLVSFNESKSTFIAQLPQEPEAQLEQAAEFFCGLKNSIDFKTR